MTWSVPGSDAPGAGDDGRGPDPGSLDPTTVIARAVAAPGGPGLLVSVLTSVPAAVHTPPRTGLFRSSPQRVQVGSWRYQVGADGRLLGAHVVGGIVLAERPLSPEAAGGHVAAALDEHVRLHGSQLAPSVAGMLSVLTRTPGF